MSCTVNMSEEYYSGSIQQNCNGGLVSNCHFSKDIDHAVTADISSPDIWHQNPQHRLQEMTTATVPLVCTSYGNNLSSVGRYRRHLCSKLSQKGGKWWLLQDSQED